MIVEVLERNTKQLVGRFFQSALLLVNHQSTYYPENFNSTDKPKARQWPSGNAILATKQVCFAFRSSRGSDGPHGTRYVNQRSFRNHELPTGGQTAC